MRTRILIRRGHQLIPSRTSGAVALTAPYNGNAAFGTPFANNIKISHCIDAIDLWPPNNSVGLYESHNRRSLNRPNQLSKRKG